MTNVCPRLRMVQRRHSARQRHRKHGDDDVAVEQVRPTSCARHAERLEVVDALRVEKHQLSGQFDLLHLVIRNGGEPLQGIRFRCGLSRLRTRQTVVDRLLQFLRL